MKRQGHLDGQILAVEFGRERRNFSCPRNGFLSGFIQEILTRGAADTRGFDLAPGIDGKHQRHHSLNIAAAGHPGIFFMLLQEFADFSEISLERRTAPGAPSLARTYAAAGSGPPSPTLSPLARARDAAAALRGPRLARQGGGWCRRRF